MRVMLCPIVNTADELDDVPEISQVKAHSHQKVEMIVAGGLERTKGADHLLK